VNECKPLMDGHDLPPGILTSVVHWLRKGGHNPVDYLDVFRKAALEVGAYTRSLFSST